MSTTSAYLGPRNGEADARNDFIDEFWIALGWDVNHEQQTDPYRHEVKVERVETASEFASARTTLFWPTQLTDTATSKNGIVIRLTEERWDHITDEHSEIARLRLDVLETIRNPVRIVAGGDGNCSLFVSWSWANRCSRVS